MTTLQGHSAALDARRTIAISGASGLIGSALAAALIARGDVVRRLVRHAPRQPQQFRWDPARGEMDVSALDGVDAVVNLAGEPIAQRWSDSVKARIRASRIDATSLLARAIAARAVRPAVLLSGSAIGIYGDRANEPLDEGSAPGSDFLALVCTEWEAAAAPAADAGVRVAHLRTGIVLARNGGALEKLLLPFKVGVGGRLASGDQWMSWIALADMVGAMLHLLDGAIAGPVNMVAPNPVTNRDFTSILGHVLHRPSLLPVPRFAMKALLGEMADGAVLASQRVAPIRLLERGYAFRFPTLEAALRYELTRSTR